MKAIFLLFRLVLGYISVPLKLSHTVTPISSGLTSSISLSSYVKNLENLQYYAYFDIGTPPQDISFVLDTGSSWIWVPNTTCDCHSSARFHSESSSSYTYVSNYDPLYYGQGEVHGDLSKETLIVDSFTVTNQYFILSYKDRDLDGLASSGLLGLAFNELSDGYLTLIENLRNQGQIENSIFSFYLNDFQNPNMLDSTFTIGGFDSEKFGQGEVKTIQVNFQNYGFWLFDLYSYAINGETYGSNSLIILDTGTSFIYGPISEVEKIFQVITESASNCFVESEMLACDCDVERKNYNYPEITFTIGGEDFNLYPESYLYYYSENLCIITFIKQYSSYWLMGQPFFRQFYTVHDLENRSIKAWRAFGLTNEEPGITNYVILGIISGIILVLVGIAVVCYCLKRKRNEDSNRYQRIQDQ